MRVEDVLTTSTCVCRTEEGRVLDGESLMLPDSAVAFSFSYLMYVNHKMLVFNNTPMFKTWGWVAPPAYISG